MSSTLFPDIPDGSIGLKSAAQAAMQASAQAVQDSAQTQLFLADLNRKHTEFKAVMDSKMEGVKAVSDLVKQSIQKSSFN